MRKAIVFVDGKVEGVNRFEQYVKGKFSVRDTNINNLIGKVVKDYLGVPRKSDDGRNNSEYFQVVDDIRSCVNLSMGFELKYTGDIVGKFLKNNEADILVIHRSSDEVRKAFLSEAMDVVSTPVFRIYFGNGTDVPNEYDYLIHPNAKDFEKQLSNIFEMEFELS